MKKAQQYTNEIIKKACQFYISHQTDKNINLTFGYFINHIVAPLNHKRLNSLIEKTLEIKKQKKRPLRILDLACGAGLISNALALPGNTVLGIDLNSEEIKLAKLFSKDTGLKTQFQIIDLTSPKKWNLKIEKILKGKPDIVVLAYALHHFEKVEQMVFRLSKWLDKGTLLLINEENTLSPTWRLKHIVRTIIQKDTHFEHQRSFKNWGRLLDKHHFKVNSYLGLDPFTFFEKYISKFCWSMVFTAEKE